MKYALLTLLVLLLSLSSIGNAPAPYWDCDGLREGDRCDAYGDYGCSHHHGTCQRQKGCTDFADTAVDECLYCQ